MKYDRLENPAVSRNRPIRKEANDWYGAEIS